MFRRNHFFVAWLGDCGGVAGGGRSGRRRVSPRKEPTRPRSENDRRLGAARWSEIARVGAGTRWATRARRGRPRNCDARDARDIRARDAPRTERPRPCDVPAKGARYRARPRPGPAAAGPCSGHGGARRAPWRFACASRCPREARPLLVRRASGYAPTRSRNRNTFDITVREDSHRSQRHTAQPRSHAPVEHAQSRARQPKSPEHRTRLGRARRTFN